MNVNAMDFSVCNHIPIVPAPYLVFNPEFPLRKTILCRTCGHALTASAPKGRGGKRYPCYHCRIKGCSLYGKSIPKKELEDGFLEELNKVSPTEEFLRVFEASMLSVWQEKKGELQNDRASIEKRVEALKAEKQGLMSMRAKELISDADFLEQQDILDNKIAVEKVNLGEATIDQYDVEGCLSFARQFINDLSRLWLEIEGPNQARFQKLVFPEGIPFNRVEGFGTAKLGQIFEVNRRFGLGELQLVEMEVLPRTQ